MPKKLETFFQNLNSLPVAMRLGIKSDVFENDVWRQPRGKQDAGVNRPDLTSEGSPENGGTPNQRPTCGERS